MSSISGTGAVWPNYSQTNVQKAANNSNVMGKEQFLQLLVAQLKHQDPLTPMDNAEYLGQLTQFSSMEQLMNIYQEISSLRQDIGSASSLIGKEVTWNEYDSSGQVVQKKGIVDSIISSDGLLYVEVGGKRVGLDYINQISAVKTETSSTSEQATNEQTPADSNEEVNG
jgi:flagellar basal-body rod modification protein FlgD